MRVDVYYNLHKKCWSIKHRGKVIQHAQNVTMEDCRFVVRPAGRERVRKEGRKNVHAFVRGTLVGFDDSREVNKGWADSHRVRYSPYADDSFVDRNSNPVYVAKLVMLGTERKVFAS